MASLKQIRSRMKAIHNIHGITKAMGMIATFRFKRAENRFSRSRNYFLELEKLVANLSSAAGEELKDPLFEKRELKKKALVVMTGDKGLCGAYNSSLLKAATVWLQENAAYQPVVIPVAKVGFEFFRRRKIATLLGYPEKAMVDLSLAKKVTDELLNAFLTGAVDSVEILYSAYRAGTPGRPVILPFLSLAYLQEKAAKQKESVDYIYEPDFVTVFKSVLSRYLEGKVYMMLLESLTSESSARMLAMRQATDNAEEVLDNLKLLRNKTRQATITRELSEIVAGASSLV
jgi:F-type H+-transporting ATPase subunit gamma